jgi:hypothetical protein
MQRHNTWGAARSAHLQHQSQGRKLNVADLTESITVGGDFGVTGAPQRARATEV